MLLTPDSVDSIHEDGGTVLGSSRGRQDETIMVETLKRMNIKLLFCIGGDGTLRCAHDIALEVERRGLNISVIGIPKTIDNDINYIDKTFGFETAVYATGPVISAAHNEAKGAPNGIGLIHVMGRDSGFIAAYATLANTHVNYCLIPEDPFSLYDGEHALLPSLERRLKLRKHAVIIVSEGAGQHLFKENSEKRDKSGNKLHHNIGEFLRDTITSWGKESNIDLTVKYFDPSYLIRQPAVERHRFGLLRNARPARGALRDGRLHGCRDRPLERPFHLRADSGRHEFAQKSRHRIRPLGQREVRDLEILSFPDRLNKLMCAPEFGSFSGARFSFMRENIIPGCRATVRRYRLRAADHDTLSPQSGESCRTVFRQGA